MAAKQLQQLLLAMASQLRHWVPGIGTRIAQVFKGILHLQLQLLGFKIQGAVVVSCCILQQALARGFIIDPWHILTGLKLEATGKLPGTSDVSCGIASSGTCRKSKHQGSILPNRATWIRDLGVEIRFGTCSVEYEMRLFKFAKTPGKHGKILICIDLQFQQTAWHHHSADGYFRQLQTQGIAFCRPQRRWDVENFQLQIRGLFSSRGQVSQYNLFMNDKLLNLDLSKPLPGSSTLESMIIAYLQTPIAVRWYCIVPSMRHDG